LQLITPSAAAQQQQQQQANTNSQLEMNQVGGVRGGGEEEVGLVETLQELEHEIECPRCNEIMTLSADFDSLCYFCQECNFSLSL
jgi:hypothetical protein